MNRRLLVRQLRQLVRPRGWPRERLRIISADAVDLPVRIHLYRWFAMPQARTIAVWQIGDHPENVTP